MTPFDAYSLDRQARGIVRFSSFDPVTGRVRRLIQRRNLILYSGADILAQLVSGAGAPVNMMYLEFKNLASPGDAITPPSFDRSGGVTYYDGLAGSPDTDFLRVPLITNPSLAASSSDYSGNQVTFFGQSEGTAGFHGKTFGPGVNSAVFGAALVSAARIDDQSEDLVYSRVYSGIDKILKEAGFEIGVTWTTRFN